MEKQICGNKQIRSFIINYWVYIRILHNWKKFFVIAKMSEKWSGF